MEEVGPDWNSVHLRFTNFTSLLNFTRELISYAGGGSSEFPPWFLNQLSIFVMFKFGDYWSRCLPSFLIAPSRWTRWKEIWLTVLDGLLSWVVMKSFRAFFGAGGKVVWEFWDTPNCVLTPEIPYVTVRWGKSLHPELKVYDLCIWVCHSPPGKS